MLGVDAEVFFTNTRVENCTFRSIIHMLGKEKYYTLVGSRGIFGSANPSSLVQSFDRAFIF